VWFVQGDTWSGVCRETRGVACAARRCTPADHPRRLLFRPFFSVQFHPEACGGPTDTAFLFGSFIDQVRGIPSAKVFLDPKIYSVTPIRKVSQYLPPPLFCPSPCTSSHHTSPKFVAAPNIARVWRNISRPNVLCLREGYVICYLDCNMSSMRD